MWGYLKVVSYFLVSSFSSLSISFPARMTGTPNVFQLQTAPSPPTPFPSSLPPFSYLCMRWSFHLQHRLPHRSRCQTWTERKIQVKIPSCGFGLQEPSTALENHSSGLLYQTWTRILICPNISSWGYFKDKHVSELMHVTFLLHK